MRIKTKTIMRLLVCLAALTMIGLLQEPPSLGACPPCEPSQSGDACHGPNGCDGIGFTCNGCLHSCGGTLGDQCNPSACYIAECITDTGGYYYNYGNSCFCYPY